MNTPTYIILDFETTGFDPTQCEIIEIGALLIEGTTEKDRFHCLVKPKEKVPRVIQELTGISQEMVDAAKPLAEVQGEFLAFLKDYPIVAHNSKLEQGFLDHHLLSEANVAEFKVYNSIDPLALILPDHSSHSMESMRKWAGIGGEGAHRADKDCEDLLGVMEFARTWLFKERPHVAQIVQHLVSDHRFKLPFWWAWFFENEAQDPPTQKFDLAKALTNRKNQGDLRELKTRDQDLLPDYQKLETLEQEVRSLLDQNLPQVGYSPRTEQVTMAVKVAQGLKQGNKLAIEAPTGTGKSIAYLVPALLAAQKTKTQVMVSTHSKSLQDQLFEKDLPKVQALFKSKNLEEPKAALVKGQDNYICLRKLFDLAQSLHEESPVEDRWAAAYLCAHATVSRLSEVDRVSQYLKTQNTALKPMLDHVRSHHTTTLGTPCPFYNACHFFDSARIAHHSHVVLANHALTFQWPQNLPQVRNILFDEGHHLEDQITESYSLKLSESEVGEWTERLSRRIGHKKVGDAYQIGRLLGSLKLQTPYDKPDATTHLLTLIEGIKTRNSELRQTIGHVLQRGNKEDSGAGYEEFIDVSKLHPSKKELLLEGFTNLKGQIRGLWDYLQAGEKAASGRSNTDADLDLLKNYMAKLGTADAVLVHLLEGDPTQIQNWLRLVWWNGRESTWRLHIAPIDVSQLSAPLFQKLRSVILTSATLSTGVSPSWVTDRVGIPLSEPLIQLPSPYNLRLQAKVFIPQDLSPPGSQGHLDSLIQFAESVATILEGRTLLLITSNRRLKMAAEVLRERLEKRGIQVIDSLSEKRAAQVFLETDKALLIGSERMGEGLDIPGKKLTCVIVEKINEAMTRSPIAEARKAKTKFGLYDYDFPLRMMWLKQRVGRLIRSTEDRGAVVVFDARYHAWSQSSRKVVDQALAPMPVLGGTRDEILQKLELEFAERDNKKT